MTLTKEGKENERISPSERIFDVQRSEELVPDFILTVPTRVCSVWVVQVSAESGHEVAGPSCTCLT